jgi:Ca2+-binding EF-hand superfamily protein
MPTRNFSALAGLGILLASASVIAAAQTKAPAQVPPLTRAAVGAKLDSDFKAVDANGDGKVTKAEIEAALSRRASDAENLLKQRQKADFDKLDTNHDGQLSLAEYEAATSLKPREGAADLRIKQLDTNKDGILTAAEFRSQALAEFDKLDKNKDGSLSVQERIAAAPKR